MAGINRPEWDTHVDQLRPAVAAVAVTGSAQSLTVPARGIYVGGAGNLVCKLVGDTADVTFTGLLAGTIYPIAIVSITSTTITNSLLLF